MNQGLHQSKKSAEAFMKILVINTGSSSLKYKLFDMSANTTLANGIVERIGERQSLISHTFFSKDGEKTMVIKKRVVDQNQGMHAVVSLITDART